MDPLDQEMISKKMEWTKRLLHFYVLRDLAEQARQKKLPYF